MKESVLRDKTPLWKLAISPLVWSLHTLACYITAAVWCAKLGRSADLTEVRYAFFIFTAIALVPIGWQMVQGYRKHSAGAAQLPHDDDTPEDRERFMGFANFLISALSALAIVFVTYNALIFRSCH